MKTTKRILAKVMALIMVVSTLSSVYTTAVATEEIVTGAESAIGLEQIPVQADAQTVQPMEMEPPAVRTEEIPVEVQPQAEYQEPVIPDANSPPEGTTPVVDGGYLAEEQTGGEWVDPSVVTSEDGQLPYMEEQPVIIEEQPVVEEEQPATEEEVIEEEVTEEEETDTKEVNKNEPVIVINYDAAVGGTVSKTQETFPVSEADTVVLEGSVATAETGYIFENWIDPATGDVVADTKDFIPDQEEINWLAGQPANENGEITVTYEAQFDELPGEFEYEIPNVIHVKVYVSEGAFEQKVELVVNQIYENTHEYRNTENALAGADKEYDGMMAFDIRFKDVKTGEEIEPAGSVRVDFEVLQNALDTAEGFAEGNDAEADFEVLHIADNQTVETVADTADASEYGVSVTTDAEGSATQIETSFMVDSFSIYVVIGHGNQKQEISQTAGAYTYMKGNASDKGAIQIDGAYYVPTDPDKDNVTFTGKSGVTGNVTAKLEKYGDPVAVYRKYNDNDYRKVTEFKFHSQEGSKEIWVAADIEGGDFHGYYNANLTNGDYSSAYVWIVDAETISQRAPAYHYDRVRMETSGLAPGDQPDHMARFTVGAANFGNKKETTVRFTANPEGTGAFVELADGLEYEGAYYRVDDGTVFRTEFLKVERFKMYNASDADNWRVTAVMENGTEISYYSPSGEDNSENFVFLHADASFPGLTDYQEDWVNVKIYIRYDRKLPEGGGYDNSWKGSENRSDNLHGTIDEGRYLGGRALGGSYFDPQVFQINIGGMLRDGAKIFAHQDAGVSVKEQQYYTFVTSKYTHDPDKPATFMGNNAEDLPNAAAFFHDIIFPNITPEGQKMVLDNFGVLADGTSNYIGYVLKWEHEYIDAGDNYWHLDGALYMDPMYMVQLYEGEANSNNRVEINNGTDWSIPSYAPAGWSEAEAKFNKHFDYRFPDSKVEWTDRYHGVITEPNGKKHTFTITEEADDPEFDGRSGVDENGTITYELMMPPDIFYLAKFTVDFEDVPTGNLQITKQTAGSGASVANGRTFKFNIFRINPDEKQYVVKTGTNTYRAADENEAGAQDYVELIMPASGTASILVTDMTPGKEYRVEEIRDFTEELENEGYEIRIDGTPQAQRGDDYGRHARSNPVVQDETVEVFIRNTFEKRVGSLRFEKVFEGEGANDTFIGEIKDQLKFTLYDVNGNKVTEATGQTWGNRRIGLNDTRYANLTALVEGNAQENRKGGYIVLDNVVPGTYYVVETGEDVNGYDLKKTINGKAFTDDGSEVVGRVEVKSGEEATITIINEYKRNTIDIPVEKKWDDNNDALGYRPSEITIKVTLKDNNEEVVAEYDLKADEDWKHTFTDLPERDENGDKIDYTVEEEIVPGYTSTVRETKDGFVIDNTLDNPGQLRGGKRGEVSPEIEKYVDYRNDGTYDLTLTLQGTASDKKLPVDILFVVDTSSSMRYGMASESPSANSRIANLVRVKNNLVNSISANGKLDARYSIVTFDGYRYDRTETDARVAVNWTGSAQAVINGLTAASVADDDDHATNYTAGLRTAATQLNAARDGAQTIVIMLSDGAPTLYTNDRGRRGGTGTYAGNNVPVCLSYAVTQAQVMNANQFYTIAIGPNSSIAQQNTHENLKSVSGAFTADIKGDYNATNAALLEQYFGDITNQIASLAITNAEIHDTLNSRAEFVTDKNGNELTELRLKVVNGQGQTIAQSNVAANANTASVTFNDQGQRVTATLTRSGRDVTVKFTTASGQPYRLNPDYKFLATMRIEPADGAYTAYAEGGYPSTGDPGTGVTSAGQRGFYSNQNNEAYVTYTYNDDPDNKEYYDKPVIQLFTKEVNVIKKWNDDGNPDKTRPNNVVIGAFDESGKLVGTTTLTGGANAATWSGRITGLRKYKGGEELTYTVKELKTGVELADAKAADWIDSGANGSYTVTISGTEQGGYTITNTLGDVTTVDVTKVWRGDAGSATFTLYNGNTQVTKDADDEDVKPITLSGDKTTDSFTNLPKYDANGRLISYTVRESVINGYKQLDGRQTGNSWTFENIQLIDIDVEKEWPQGAPANASVTVQLMNGSAVAKDADGKDVAALTLRAGNWKGTFKDLPRFDGAKEIEYSVKEIAVTGYTTTVKKTEVKDGAKLTGYKFTVTNTKEPEINKDIELENGTPGDYVKAAQDAEATKALLRALDEVFTYKVDTTIPAKDDLQEFVITDELEGVLTFVSKDTDVLVEVTKQGGGKETVTGRAAIRANTTTGRETLTVTLDGNYVTEEYFGAAVHIEFRARVKNVPDIEDLLEAYRYQGENIEIPNEVSYRFDNTSKTSDKVFVEPPETDEPPIVKEVSNLAGSNPDKSHLYTDAYDETFRFEITTAIPKKANLSEYKITDRLDDVLVFTQAANQIQVTVDGKTLTGAAAFDTTDPQTLVVTIPEANLKNNRGDEVKVVFQARINPEYDAAYLIANGYYVEADEEIQIPNTAKYVFTAGNETTENESEEVLVTPPDPDDPPLDKTVEDGNEKVTEYSMGEYTNPVTYNLDTTIPVKKNLTSFVITDALDKVLTFVSREQDVIVTIEGVSGNIEGAAKIAIGQDGIETLTVTIPAQYLASEYRGKAVHIEFDARVNEGKQIGNETVDFAYLLKNGYFKEDKDRVEIPNKAKYVFQAGGNDPKEKDSNEVIIIPDPETIDIEVEKIWNTEDAQAPQNASVTIQLTDGSANAKDKDGNEIAPVTLNGRKWTQTFEGLPKFDGNREIVYGVKEIAVEGFTTNVEKEEVKDAEGKLTGYRFAVTNTPDPEINKDIELANGQPGDYTFAEIEENRKKAILKIRNEVFTYKVDTFVPAKDDLQEFEITDELKDVLTFVSTEDEVIVTVKRDGRDAEVLTGTGAAKISIGQNGIETLTVKIPKEYLTKDYFGAAVHVEFRAKVKEITNIEDMLAQYETNGHVEIPNDVTYKFDNTSKTSDKVYAEPPQDPDPEIEKEVSNLTGTNADNKHLYTDAYDETFKFVLNTEIPKKADLKSFVITDTLDHVLTFAQTEAQVEVRIGGVKVDGTVTFEDAKDKKDKDSKQLVVTVPQANLTNDKGKTVEITFLAKINPDYDYDYLVANGYLVPTATGQEAQIPNEASYTFVAGDETKTKPSDVVIVTPPDKTIDIEVEKRWDPEPAPAGAEITVELIRVKDGVETATGRTLVLNRANNFKDSFKDVPFYDGDQEAQYTISEIAVTGYATKVEGNKDDGFIVTNTEKPEINKDVEVENGIEGPYTTAEKEENAKKALLEVRNEVFTYKVDTKIPEQDKLESFVITDTLASVLEVAGKDEKEKLANVTIEVTKEGTAVPNTAVRVQKAIEGQTLTVTLLAPEGAKGIDPAYYGADVHIEFKAKVIDGTTEEQLEAFRVEGGSVEIPNDVSYKFDDEENTSNTVYVETPDPEDPPIEKTIGENKETEYSMGEYTNPVTYNLDTKIPVKADLTSFVISDTLDKVLKFDSTPDTVVAQIMNEDGTKAEVDLTKEAGAVKISANQQGVWTLEVSVPKQYLAHEYRGRDVHIEFTASVDAGKKIGTETVNYEYLLKNGYFKEDKDRVEIPNKAKYVFEAGDKKTEKDSEEVIIIPDPETIDIDVEKVWNTEDGEAPEDASVTVQLMNGTKEVEGATLVLNKGNDFKGTFTDLPKHEGEAEIDYTVKEIAVEGFTTVITGDKETGFTITNTPNPEINKDIEIANGVEGDYTLAEKEENRKKALLRTRNEVFTYTVDTFVPAKDDLQEFEITDTLEHVLTFVSKEAEVAVTVKRDGRDAEVLTGTGAAKIAISQDGIETLTVTIPKDYLTTDYFGAAVKVVFKAKVKEGATEEELAKYITNGHVEIPNDVSYKFDNTSETSDKVYAEPPQDPDPEIEKTVENLTGTNADNKHLHTDDQKEAFRFVLNTEIPKKADLKSFEITDTLDHVLMFATEEDGVEVRIGGVKVSGTVTFKDAKDKNGKDSKQLVVTVPEANLASDRGKTVEVSFIAKINPDYDYDYLVANGYFKETAQEVQIPNQASYTFNAGDDPEVSKDSDVVIVTPPDKTINIPVVKKWAGKAPETAEITVELIRVTTDAEGNVTETATGRTLELNDGNGWRDSFKDVPFYDGEEEAQYTITEIAVKGYATKVEGDKDTGFTVTNSEIPEINKDVEVENGLAGPYTTAAKEANAKKALLEVRNEVFTYKVDTKIPEQDKLETFVITDTLESVLEVPGEDNAAKLENVTVTVTKDGTAVPDTAVVVTKEVNGQEVKVTLSKPEDAKGIDPAYYGADVHIEFKAKVIDDVTEEQLEAFRVEGGSVEIPNDVSYKFDDEENTSNTVYVETPDPEEPPLEKTVGEAKETEYSMGEYTNPVTYNLDTKIPEKADLRSFVISDTLDKVLKFNQDQTAVVVQIMNEAGDNVEAELTGQTGVARISADQQGIWTLEVSIPGTYLASAYRGRAVHVAFEAAVDTDKYDYEYLLKNGYFKQDKGRVEIPNKAKYVFQAGGDDPKEKDSNEVIIIPDPETIDIEVEKVWNTENNEAPENASITVELLDGTTPVKDAEGNTVSETLKDGSWKHTFEDVPRFDGTREIVYDVKEIAVEGFTTYVRKETKRDGDRITGYAFTVTNTPEPEVNKDVELKNGVEGEYTLAEKEENRKKALLRVRDEVFTYTIATTIPAKDGLQEVTLTDTLDKVLDFAKNNVESATIGGQDVTSDNDVIIGMLDGKLTVTIRGKYVTEDHFGDAVEVRFTAKLKDGVTDEDLEAYRTNGKAEVPNDVSYDFGGNEPAVSDRVYVEIPEYPEIDKEVDSANGATVNDAKTHADLAARDEVFSYTVKTTLPERIVKSFTVTDDVVKELRIVEDEKSKTLVSVTVDGKAPGNNATVDVTDGNGTDVNKVTVTFTDADYLKENAGKAVEIRFDAQIRDNADISQYFEGGQNGVPNDASYEIVLPDDSKITDTSEPVTVTPPDPEIDKDINGVEAYELSDEREEVTYTIRTEIPEQAVSSFVITDEIKDVMEFVGNAADVDVKVVKRDRSTYNHYAKVTISGQKLTVDFDAKTLEEAKGANVTVSFKAKVRDNVTAAQLQPYLVADTNGIPNDAAYKINNKPEEKSEPVFLTLPDPEIKKEVTNKAGASYNGEKMHADLDERYEDYPYTIKTQIPRKANVASFTIHDELEPVLAFVSTQAQVSVRVNSVNARQSAQVTMNGNTLDVRFDSDFVNAHLGEDVEISFRAKIREGADLINPTDYRVVDPDYEYQELTGSVRIPNQASYVITYNANAVLNIARANGAQGNGRNLTATPGKNGVVRNGNTVTMYSNYVTVTPPDPEIEKEVRGEGANDTNDYLELSTPDETFTYAVKTRIPEKTGLTQFDIIDVVEAVLEPDTASIVVAPFGANGTLNTGAALRRGTDYTVSANETAEDTLGRNGTKLVISLTPSYINSNMGREIGLTFDAKVKPGANLTGYPVSGRGESLIPNTVQYTTNIPNVFDVSDKVEVLPKPELTDVTIEKIWDDDNNRDGKRPAQITVRLYNGNTNTQVAVATIRPDARGNWSHTFTDLPKYYFPNGYEAVGVPVDYVATEDPVAGYAAAVVDPVTANGTIRITNPYDPEKTSVSVVKTWNDANNGLGNRPASVTIRLRADGADTGRTLTLNANNGWRGSFTDLDVYKPTGVKIAYTVTEDDVEGYTSTITQNSEYAFYIENTADNGRLTVIKSVNGAPAGTAITYTFRVTNAAGTEVASISITGDGSQEITVAAGRYTVTEIGANNSTLTGYSMVTTGSGRTVQVPVGGESTVTITNTYTPDTPPTTPPTTPPGTPGTPTTYTTTTPTTTGGEVAGTARPLPTTPTPITPATGEVLGVRRTNDPTQDPAVLGARRGKTGDASTEKRTLMMMLSSAAALLTTLAGRKKKKDEAR